LLVIPNEVDQSLGIFLHITSHSKKFYEVGSPFSSKELLSSSMFTI